MNTKTKILIVEHDQGDLALLELELKKGRINYISEVVNKEPDYINALKNFDPDIILSDYSFPSSTGPAAFQIKESIAPGTPFILVSNTIREEQSIQLIKSGITDYVLKDELYTLNPKIQRALNELKERRLISKVNLELIQSEKQYRQIVETSQEGIWLIDENNYTVLVNKKMAEILGYDSWEMMGKKNYFFMDDEWKKIASDHIVSRKTGMNEHHEFKYISKNGKDVWANISTNPVFDEAGIYKGALAMVTDITDQKAAIAQLIKSEQGYRALFEHNLTGIYQTTIPGAILNCNEALAKMLKYDSPEELLGINAYELYFSRKERNDFLRNLQEQKKLFNYEAILKCKDGSILHVIENNTLRQDAVTGAEVCDGILIDITDRKKTQQEIEWRSIIQKSPLYY